MCTSPLFLNPYRNTFGAALRIPCGQCLECRESAHSNWLYRLGLEFKRCQDNDGTPIFLTFTYNNLHLPKSNFGIFYEKKVGDHTIALPSAPVSCFNKRDVSNFLNTLKAHMFDTYGAGSYRFFWVSEFGSDTKRPHYHCIFLLRKDVNMLDFCLWCRSHWTYGFMFPKYNDYRKCFVDNDGKTTTPLISKSGACGKYASKYITKDLDFLKVPIVKQYMSIRKYYSESYRKCYDSYLPFFKCSKSFGAQTFSPAELLSALQNGVTDYFSHRVVTLPRYYIQANAFSTLNYDGKIYRVLKPEYSDCYRQIVRNSFFNTVHKIQNFVLNINPSDFLEVYESPAVAAENFKYMVDNIHIDYKYAYLNWIYSHLSSRSKDLFGLYATSLDLDLKTYVDFRLSQLDPFLIMTDSDRRKSDLNSVFRPFEPIPELVRFVDIYFDIQNHVHKVQNAKSYADYQKVRKLRLMSKGLL